MRPGGVWAQAREDFNLWLVLISAVPARLPYTGITVKEALKEAERVTEVIETVVCKAYDKDCRPS